MAYRKGELSPSGIDRGWPFQVALPASVSLGGGYRSCRISARLIVVGPESRGKSYIGKENIRRGARAFFDRLPRRQIRKSGGRRGRRHEYFRMGLHRDQRQPTKGGHSPAAISCDSLARRLEQNSRLCRIALSFKRNACPLSTEAAELPSIARRQSLWLPSTPGI
jgi:hypothetical protein